MEKGKKTKRSKNHIKIEVLVATKGGITFSLVVEVGRAYADERKVLKEIIDKVSLKVKSYIIGDRLYGMDNQLAKVLIEKEGLIPVIPVRDGIRNRVRDRYRRRLKEMYE